MDKNTQLLDIVVDYINEQGLWTDFLDWAEMYDHDREKLEENIDNRYENIDF